MSEIVTLQDALDLIKQSKGDFKELVNVKEFWAFAERIDNSTVAIMKDKENDYVLGMLSLVQSLSATILIMQGKDPLKVMMLLEDDVISDYAALIMKFTIGLAAMEELR